MISLSFYHEIFFQLAWTLIFDRINKIDSAILSTIKTCGLSRDIKMNCINKYNQ